MSKIINDLASIEVSNETLHRLNVDSIYRDFSRNYKRLDDLKKFRSDYENKNALMRWWDNDKLQDAHLDSAEVQAEFSKTIGQLMMISIMQSKKLAEQQVQLNEQQGNLRRQADGISEHAGALQKQHHVLAEQALKLETLVHEYFALKGLTEDGAQKLIDIACEVKTTKDGMLQAFAVRAKDVEVLCGDLASQMVSLSAQVNDQIRQSAEQTQLGINALQHEMLAVLAASESALRNELDAVQQSLKRNMATLEQVQCETEASQKAKNAALELSLSCLSSKLEQQEAAYQEKLRFIEGELARQAVRTTDVANDLSGVNKELVASIQQQQTLLETLGQFQYEATGRIKRLGYVAAGLSVVVLGMLGGMAHLLRWI